MTAKYVFANNATTSLAVAAGVGDTTLYVVAGQGQLFPSPGEGEAFSATLSNTLGTLNEVVLVTARSGDTMTVTRAQEGTDALVWPVGTRFEELVTKGQLESFVQRTEVGTGIPYKEVDLGSGGGTVELSLSDLPVGAAVVMLAVTAGAAIEISDIVGATVPVIVIIAVAEGSSDVSIPLGTVPFFLSNISGDYGWPGYPLSTISLLFNPLNTDYKWVETGRTWRTS